MTRSRTDQLSLSRSSLLLLLLLLLTSGTCQNYDPSSDQKQRQPPRAQYRTFCRALATATLASSPVNKGSGVLSLRPWAVLTEPEESVCDPRPSRTATSTFIGSHVSRKMITSNLVRTTVLIRVLKGWSQGVKADRRLVGRIQNANQRAVVNRRDQGNLETIQRSFASGERSHGSPVPRNEDKSSHSIPLVCTHRRGLLLNFVTLRATELKQIV